MLKKIGVVLLSALLCCFVLTRVSLPVRAAETASSAADAAQTPSQTETAPEKHVGVTEKFALWFEGLFSEGVGGEIIAFLASMLPIIECRGGMIIAKGFQINFFKAFALCYIGNMIPMPFILLLIKKIFAFMKAHNILTGFIAKLEGKTDKNREKVLRYKQWGLLAFIAIPLPGTGGWTGSLFAALLDIDFKKALPIVALGVFIADLIMSVVTYGAGAVFGF